MPRRLFFPLFLLLAFGALCDESAFTGFPARTAAINRFVSWAGKRGISADVELRPSVANKTRTLRVYAARDFRTNEKISCIPQEAQPLTKLIFAQTAMGKAVLSELNLKELAGAGVTAKLLYVALVTRLVHDADREEVLMQANFRQWLDVFPFHLGEDLAAPLWSDAAREVIKDLPFSQRHYQADYNLVKAEVFDKLPEVFGEPLRPAYSFRNFTAIYGALSLRWFERVGALPGKDGFAWDQMFVVPLVDLLREELGPTAVQVSINDTICFGATEPIKVGTELRLSRRGPLPLPYSLSELGMVPTNPDLIELRVGVDADWYAGFLLQGPRVNFFDNTNAGFEVAINPIHWPGKLLAHHRVYAYAKALHEAGNGEVKYEDLTSVADAAFCLSDKVDFAKKCGISAENEREARQDLVAKLQGLIESVPSSERQDSNTVALLRKLPAEVLDRKLLQATEYRLRVHRLVRVIEEKLLPDPLTRRVKEDL